MRLAKLVVAACLTLSLTSSQMALERVGPHEAVPSSFPPTSVEAMVAPPSPSPVPTSEPGMGGHGGTVPPAQPMVEGEVHVAPRAFPSPRIVGTKPKQPKQRRSHADASGGGGSRVGPVGITDSERVVLACIRGPESGGNYRAINGAGYFGAYQFDIPTWRSNGGTGLPHLAPPQVQDDIATLLLRRRGLQPWSTEVEREC